jgi:hypothetical protein
MPEEIKDTSEDNLGYEVPKAVNPMLELGLTGIKRTSGYIDEEFLPQLRGRKAVQIFREMKDNDPVIGALLFATDRLLRQVEWRVEPASDKKEDKDAAEFIKECMEDMSHTWDDMITEILTMLPYGWSWHEIVYKRRVGPHEENSTRKSKFTDGKIGWRKIPIRSQETWLRWIFDDDGGLKAMVQMSPPHYKTTVLPVDKCLLFRTSTEKNNPEGRSFLRNSYRPWYMKKRLEEIEAIGAERDLAGLPVAKIPREYLAAPPGSDRYKMTEAFKKMVRSVRRNEQEGLILPQEYDTDTKQPLFEFELLSGGGGRQFQIGDIIKRYEERMLMSVLADFILVGHQGVGSYSLHTDKTGLFRASMNSIAQTIADVFNNYAIPRLFKVNGWKVDNLPKLIPSDVDPPDITQLGAFMGQMQSAGVEWFPDPELEKFVRNVARLPELSEENEKVLETQDRQAQIISVAQQRLQIIQMQQQAEQGAMSMEQQKMGVEQQKMSTEDQATAREQGIDPNAQKLQQGDEAHKMNMAGKQQQLAHQDEANKLKLAAMKKPKEKK